MEAETLCQSCHKESQCHIPCTDCKSKFCDKCLQMTPELCKSIKEMPGCSWRCKLCIQKSDSIKSLLESVQSKMDEDKKDRDRVIQSLQSVEAMNKRLDTMEDKQEAHDRVLSSHDEIIKQQEGKIKELETKASQNFDFDKLVDSAAKESAEREKRSRNFLVHRLPELPHLNPDDSMKDDIEKVNLLVSKVVPSINIVRAFRIGKPRLEGENPRILLVTVVEEIQAKSVINASYAKMLTQVGENRDIYCTKDRSIVQRKVARDSSVATTTLGNAEGTHPGRGRGRGRGNGRGRGRGRGRGNGPGNVAGSRNQREESGSGSRKRSLTGEVAQKPLEKKSKAETPAVIPSILPHPVPLPDPMLCTRALAVPNEKENTQKGDPKNQAVGSESGLGLPLTEQDDAGGTQTSFLALMEETNDGSILSSTLIEKPEGAPLTGIESLPKGLSKNL